jgi:hypothetical protein
MTNYCCGWIGCPIGQCLAEEAEQKAVRDAIAASLDAAFMNVETKARELLAAQLPSLRKRAVLLAGRPATYVGGITAPQALRAICEALKAHRQ